VEKALHADRSFQLIDARERLEELGREGALEMGDLESFLRGPYLRTIPGVHPMDGFFAAILERG
jgi:16S rRNA C967 or C1407 C5-methylase (RsmB/RsmF family)